MIFTNHAENKFDILNKHGVYFTREQIEDVVLSPERKEKKDKHIFVKRESIGVVYRENNGQKEIVTFYPIKQDE